MANNSVQDARSKAQEAGSKATEHARDVASDVASKAREVGHDVAQKARDVGGDLADAGRSALSAAGKTADNAVGTAGQSMQSLAGTVREYGSGSGVMGQATETVAHTLERGGQYLQKEGLSGMTDDLTDMIKRNPIPALLFGVGIGFVLARLTSNRS